MVALVTGASGFLGGRVAQLLCAQGAQVSVLARTTSDLRHLTSCPVDVVYADLADREQVKSATRPVTHIFHCAACSTDWAPLRQYVAANVAGTRHLLAAAADSSRLQRLLHISTTDVYGYPEQPCTEDHPIVDAGLPYNQTKGGAEAAVWEAHAQGLPVTVLRPATIYGPRGKDFTQEIAVLLKRRLMATIGGGAAPGGFTYIDNVAEAAITAACSPRTVGEAYNLADGTGVTWLQYAARLARLLKVQAPWIDLSYDRAMSLARAFEAAHRTLRLKQRPLLTRHAVRLLGGNQEFPAGKARRDFGFLPRVSLDEGLDRSVAWLQDKSAPRRT